MIRTKILIGFITGVAATVAGIVLYILLFSEMEINPTLRDAIKNNYLGKIIVLGAALNFLPFFVFLKRNLIYHARGVLLSMVVTALALAFYKIL